DRLGAGRPRHRRRHGTVRSRDHSASDHRLRQRPHHRRSGQYDALPEIGHACGHNIIATAGVGAFLALHALYEADPDSVPGTVVLLGTPAEEGHSGKEVMARAGAFDGLDAAIMVHGYGYDCADQVWLGRRLLRVTFSGIAAHASA